MRNPLRFAISVILFIIFLFVADLVVFDATVFVFTIISSGVLFVFAVILSLLTVGFIGSMFLGRNSYTPFTRFASLITSSWMGMFTYYFFASCVIGIVALLPFSEHALQNIDVFLFSFATLVSVYGFIHARSIFVRDISVTLPHLPEVWKGRKILWISDIHLGQILHRSFMQKIVNRIQTLSPDILFIGGDLFDGTQAIPLEDFIAPLRELSIPLGIYFISGNHEEFGDGEPFFEAIRKTGITILNDEKVMVDGLQIIGVDYKKASKHDNFKAILETLAIDTHAPSILLKHVPDNIDIAHDAGISLQISGHTHYGQQFPFGLIASHVYKGFAYGLKMFNEMYVYTSSGVGTWGPPLRLGSDSEMVMFHFESSENASRG